MKGNGSVLQGRGTTSRFSINRIPAVASGLEREDIQDGAEKKAASFGAWDAQIHKELGQKKRDTEESGPADKNSGLYWVTIASFTRTVSFFTGVQYVESESRRTVSGTRCKEKEGRGDSWGMKCEGIKKGNVDETGVGGGGAEGKEGN